jgi:hypothetical protein
MSYYQKWFTALVECMPLSGLVTREEIETGKRARGSPKTTPALTATQVPQLIACRGEARPQSGPRGAASNGRLSSINLLARWSRPWEQII